MAYENKDGGAMFKNVRKTKDSHPDYTGTGNYDGVDFEISAWVKEGRNGKPKFFSFSFKEPYKRDQPREDRAGDPFDDEGF